MVQIVTDDRPFLVDSVTMEVLRQGWSIREIFHPQFIVRRDLGGTLHGVVRRSEAEHDPTVLPESWMHLEILPPARPSRAEEMVAELEQGLLEVLRLVEETVEDWQKMGDRAKETIGGPWTTPPSSSATRTRPPWRASCSGGWPATTSPSSATASTSSSAEGDAPDEYGLRAVPGCGPGHPRARDQALSKRAGQAARRPRRRRPARRRCWCWPRQRPTRARPCTARRTSTTSA